MFFNGWLYVFTALYLMVLVCMFLLHFFFCFDFIVCWHVALWFEYVGCFFDKLVYQNIGCIIGVFSWKGSSVQT